MSEDQPDENLSEAIENSEGIIEAGETISNCAFEHVARETGRTVENQIERMGDSFEYDRVNQNSHQRQLDDYYVDDGVLMEEMPVSSFEIEKRQHTK